MPVQYWLRYIKPKKEDDEFTKKLIKKFGYLKYFLYISKQI